MARVDTLTSEIKTILSTSWDKRDGIVIPTSTDVVLKNGAVEVEATFLYADLAGSSKLAELCPWDTTAKIIRAYLDCCTRSIRAHGGEIRSFDGDRVMGIFKNDTPNINATNCAREIFWMVENILNPVAKEKFKSIRDNDIFIKHCIGIDTGTVQAVRAGIRSNNDLIWIGKAPSFAAKLSDIRNYPYSICISKACFNKLPESSKKSGAIDIWKLSTMEFVGKTEAIYHTNYMLKP